MTDKLVAVPAADAEPFVRLGRTKQGRMFKKHILNKGVLHYPGVKDGKVVIDDEFIATLTRNFENKVCDIVQVPKAGANNEHTEDPDRNIGEVTDIVVEGDKVYAYIDARTDDADKLGKTLLGASAMMSLNYKDTHTNEFVGPALLHVAITNRPYITKLDDFSEVESELIAATAEYTNEMVLLTPVVAEMETASMPTLDEVKASLKEHGYDLDALLAAKTESDKTVDLTAKLATALEGLTSVKLSNSDGAAAQPEEVVGAVATLVEKSVELSNKNVELSNSNTALAGRISSLEKASVDAEIAGYVSAGRVLPAQVEAFTTLALSNRELFDSIVPAEPVVKLSQEVGATPVDEAPEFDVDAYVLDIASRGKRDGLGFKNPA